MSARRAWQQHLAAAAALAGFVAALYARLLFTNRVLAEGDILYYFYPYRDYAAAALREGHLPLWNPYIFLGAPFLANPQAAVLYPLHWPLSWLPVTAQIAWSAALHTWIVGLGGYALLRGWGKSAWAGLAAGLVLAGSGFFGGLIGHINQMNAAAWLPWALWVLVRADAAADWRGRAQGAPAAAGRFALLITHMLLAGHTQTAYINLAGLGLWCVWPLIGALRRRSWAAPARQIARRLAVYGVGVVVGGLTAAPQLLPTLELSGRGLRQGGLSYAEASSFSLKPLQLLWSLLPSYGLADLSAVFGTSGYTEYVAYVGLIGPALAIWAARRGAWRRVPFGRGLAVETGLLLAAIGLFLALGRWNPVYYLLYVVVPGFDLFRAPARWMMLYTLGMAILAGAGLDVLRRGWASWVLPVLICALIAGELLIAGLSLPHTQPTAPQAVTDLRTAPAHLLTDPDRRLHPAAGGRFMSMSVVTFDPGDMPDYRRIMLESDPPQLDARAFARLIIALKVQEIIAPNLALLWRIPSLDGFDGGVLPLRRYLDLLSLFAPADELIPDGRLRERVREIPPTDLLALYNVRYVITDKTADLWFRDIYYDRQIGAHLGRDRPTAVIAADRGFSATQVNLIATLEAAGDAPLSDGAIIGQVTVSDDAGEQRFDLLAGSQIAAAALDSPSAGATIAYRDVDAGRQEYLVELPLAGPTTVHTVTVTWQPAAPDLPPLTVQAVTLVDGRTAMFSALLPSDRGRYRRVHSGDVKVYENLDVLPRAYLVQRTLPAADPDQAIALLAKRDFDPATTAVVEAPLTLDGTRAPGDAAMLVAYAPERVVVATTSAAPALLVLSDTHDPGWHATMDGTPAAILRANGHVRGVAVPAGRHTVEFVYAPPSWPRGLAVGAAGAALLVLLLTGPRLLSLRRSARDSV